MCLLTSLWDHFFLRHTTPRLFQRLLRVLIHSFFLLFSCHFSAGFTCGHTHRYSRLWLRSDELLFQQNQIFPISAFSRRHVASPKRYRLFELFFSTLLLALVWLCEHALPSSSSSSSWTLSSGIEEDNGLIWYFSFAFHHLFTIAQMFSPPHTCPLLCRHSIILWN